MAVKLRESEGPGCKVILPLVGNGPWVIEVQVLTCFP